MSFILLIALLAVARSDLQSLSLDFFNDQAFFVLGYPQIQITNGLHTDCFGKLGPNEMGHFGASSQSDGLLSGYLSIPVYRPVRPSPYNLHIYWDMNNNQIGIDIGDSAQKDMTTLKTVATGNNTWQDFDLGTVRAAIYLSNTGSVYSKIRLYYQPRISSGKYRIRNSLNNLLVSNGGSNASTPAASRFLNNQIYNATLNNGTNQYQYFNITWVFDQVYVINPLDAAFQPLNWALGAQLIHDTQAQWINGNFVSWDPRQLWELKPDLWGRWTIRFYGANLYWSNENDPSIGKLIQLKPQTTADQSQYFIFDVVSA